MTKKEFTQISASIPLLPGIYKYFNRDNNLIYVGKAIHLRKRVSSYFNKSHSSNKTTELVKRIHHIEFTIVDNEQDAFFLENSLIKEYQPVYNILLKDDKTYPYIVIKNEPFPRVFFTRSKLKDKSKYLGPYTSINKVRELLEFIKQNIPLRTCKLNLSEKNIKKNKYKVCLEYHLGNCKGPCEGFQSLENYDDGIEKIMHLLKGNLQPVITEFKTLVKYHSENLEFEKAEMYLQKIKHLQNYHSRSLVVNAKTGTVDVFSIFSESETAYVNYLAVHNGCIIQTKTLLVENRLDAPREDVLLYAINDLRKTFNSEAKEIILPFKLNYPDKSLKITVPKTGDKKKLLALSEKNVNHFRTEIKLKKILHIREKTQDEKDLLLSQLQADLQLPEIPVHIECFDNSNFQGSHPVAAMVCFKNGIASKTEYRHYNIKTVSGINDFASMEEVVYRRYKRLMEENKSLPQLVIIDGGKGQLNAAMSGILKLGLTGKTSLVGLAKNKEEIFFPGDSHSILLPWNSESLHLIRSIRDEVHRVGISFHRQKRSIAALENELEKIPGIGNKTAEVLLKKFKSVKKISEQNSESLIVVVGTAKAKIITDYFHQKQKKGPG